MNQTNTRAMVETAFISAIIVMLTIVGSTVPFLSLLATIVAPAAIALIGIRWEVKYSIASTVVSLLLVAIVLGPLAALGTVFMYGPPSILLGMGFRGYWNSVKLILLPALALCITTVLTMVVAFGATSFDITSALQASNIEFKDMLKASLEQQQMPPEQVAAYMTQIDQSFEQVKKMVVAYGFSTMAILSYIMARFTSFLAKRTNNPVKTIPAISSWQMPIWSAGILAIGLIIVYGSSYLGINNELLTIIGMNLGLFGAFVCGLNGISCLLALLNAYNVARFLKVIIVIFFYFMAPISLVVFGIIDMFMDLRSRYQPRG